MKPGPASVAEIILTGLPLNAAPESLDDVVQRIIAEHPEWGYLPEDQGSLWASKVEAILERHLKRSLEEGRQPRFAFNSFSSYKIQGACFIEPRDPPEVEKQKRLRFRWHDYYQYLCQLNPDFFELLCARILTLIGVPKPHLTPYRADQGIDFFGKMSIGDLTGHGPLFPVSESNLVVWLVGQAKHYLHNKVSTPDIRELVGSAVLGRSGTYSKDTILHGLNIRSCDPVVMLFFTTGGISTDGWSLCRKAGIVAMDGEMLATFLADKEVGLTKAKDGPRFNQDALTEWVGKAKNILGGEV
jgi:hypothetical protein